MSHVVLLDGEFVPTERITPSLHRFIGLFRKPIPPQPKANLWCSCGHVLQTQADVNEHWRSGHFDVPQYASIGLE